MFEYEATIIEMINSAIRMQKVQPLTLGGVSASGGGVGGPPGGFLGLLPQTAVAYDMSEEASADIPVSGTLLDNLNHLRYLIANISGGGGGHTIEEEGSPLTQRTKLNFVGTTVTVTDDPGDNATVVTITASGGGGGHTIQGDGVSKTQRTNLNFVGVSVTDDSVNDATIVTLPSGLTLPMLMLQEDHSAECNDVTVEFLSDNPFVLETTHIFLNGLLQKVNDAYTENTDCRSILFDTAPFTGDSLTFAYIINSDPPGELVLSGPYLRSGAVIAYHAGTHAHTTASDGEKSPSAYNAAIEALGYTALIMTDHDLITADPGDGSILYIPSNEYSPSTGHIVGLNTSYLRVAVTDQQTIIDEITADGGISILAHPKWTTGHTYSNMAARTGFTGLEIFNMQVETGAGGSTGVANPGFDIADWDSLLTNVRRDIFGFASDDYHAVSDFKTYGIGRSSIFSEDTTVSGIISAISHGDFVAEVSNYGVTPELPAITEDNVIITCDGATRIRFVGDSGTVLDTVEGSSAEYAFVGTETYVRIEAVGEYIEPFSTSLDRYWDTIDGTWTVTGGLLAQTGTGGAKRIVLKRFRAGDFTAQIDVKLSSTATDHSASLMFNVLDSNCFYIMRLGGTGGGAFDGKLAIGKTTTNSFASETPIAYYTFSPSISTWYTMKMEYTASTGRIRAKIWVVGAAEPDWQLDGNSTVWTHGCFGIRAGDESDYDNLDIDGFITYFQPIPVGDWT